MSEKFNEHAVGSRDLEYPTIMTAAQAAEYLCSNTSTLADWRMKGVGPKFARLGKRCAYRRDWLDSWLETRAVSSTAEAKRLGSAQKEKPGVS